MPDVPERVLAFSLDLFHVFVPVCCHALHRQQGMVRACAVSFTVWRASMLVPQAGVSCAAQAQSYWQSSVRLRRCQLQSALRSCGSLLPLLPSECESSQTGWAWRTALVTTYVPGFAVPQE